MKRILLLILFMLTGYAYGQVCGAEDTVTNNNVTLITYNSARINGTVSDTIAETAASLILRYVRVGFTDTVSSSSAPSTALRNLTGLQSATQYVYYYRTICPFDQFNQSVAYYFTTLQSTVTYTPMTAAGYQYKYVKVDSGFIVPRLDTGLNRSPNIGGQIKFRPADSTFYGYNGAIWKPLAIDSSGIIDLLNDKVDSVTVAGDSLWYWKLGVSYGYVLPGAITTASNGLTEASNNVKLGGTLVENTTIAGGGFNMITSGVKAWEASTSGAGNYIYMQALGSNPSGQLSRMDQDSSRWVSTVTFGLNSSFIDQRFDDIYLTSTAGDIELDGVNVLLQSASAGKVGIGVGVATDSLLTVQDGFHSKRGVRFSGLPTAVGTKAVRIDATGVLSIADTSTGGGVPSLTATQIGYGDGSNLLDGDATLTFAVGTGIVTAPKYIANSNTDGGGANDAAYLIQRTVNEANGTHGFRDKTIITGTVTGTAGLDIETTLNGGGASVEMVGAQVRHIINKSSGTLATSWSYLDNAQILSPVTSLVGFESHAYLYAGAAVGNRFGIRILEYEGSNSLVSNTYGIYWNALTKATGDNYGSYDNGSNKHYLYDVRAGNKIYVGGDVSATAKLHIAAGSATANTAPIKLTSGAVNTVIVGGQKEYNNAHYGSTSALNRYAEGGAIQDFITTVDNGTTVETDLYTYTTKASTLAADGEKISFKISGTFNDITATAQLQFYYGGTNIGNTGALTVSATGGWNADVMVIRTGASTARSVVTVNTPGASTAVYTTQTDLTGLTFTNTQIIKITGTAAGASGGTGDISAKMATIFWHGAANN